MDEVSRRLALIAELEKARESLVLCYVTSTRPNLEAPMAMDVIPIIYRNLHAAFRTASPGRIDLLLHTNGGEAVVPWRLLALLRSFASEINVLVPHRALSSGTLTALGADHVVMHPMGTLGPIDPTVHGWFNPPHPFIAGQTVGINTEDVSSFFDFLREDVGVEGAEQTRAALLALLEKVHPLALGGVRRSTLQSRMLGQRLLSQGDATPAASVEAIVDRLASDLHSHGHPISSREARDDLGLAHVEDAPHLVADLIWEIYEAYRRELALEEAFDPVTEVSGGRALPLPEGEGVIRLQLALGPLRVVVVESRAATDFFELTYDAVVSRDWAGNTSTSLTLVHAGWRQTR